MKSIKKSFKDAKFQFVLSTGIKVAAIFIFILLLATYIVWIFISFNTLFVEANTSLGFPGMQEAYKDFVITSSLEKLPYIFLFIILLFLGGMYLAKVLLRPFNKIEEYCTKRSEGEHAEYLPDTFSDYKMLTSFSEYFFTYLNDIEERKHLFRGSIPPQYTKIHRPVFEKVFFFHFTLLIAIIAIVNTMFTNLILGEIQDGVLNLALKNLNEHKIGSSFFLREQEAIFQSLSYFLTGILIVYYLILSLHLYGRVSGAVFGFFSTMRSFMKGNYNSRVHLLGYNHVRSSGRSFNKYLKYISEKYDEEKTRN